MDKIGRNVKIEKLIRVEFAEVINLLVNKFTIRKKKYFFFDAGQIILNEKERAKNMSITIDSLNQFYGFIKAQIPSNVRLIIVAGHSMIAKSGIYSGILFII